MANPELGVVYDIMRQTRARYHYAIRSARHHENDTCIVNDRFASALILNSGRYIWTEVKKIRRSGSRVSGAVGLDGVSDASDIVGLFARKCGYDRDCTVDTS